MTGKWDREIDVLVVGSGAGGLLSALVAATEGAETLIIEKAALWGGTSATSGGGIWIPKSDQAAAAGFDDSFEDAFTYVRGLSAADVPDANIRAFVENASVMLRWMTQHTGISYEAHPYPDYHAENPGGSPTGFRTHMPLPVDGSALGKDVRTLRFASPAASLFGYLNWHFDETYIMLFRPKGWWISLAKSLARYWLDLPFRLTSRKDRRLTLGNALSGGLRIALNERKIPIHLGTSLEELVAENGNVVGARIRRNGKIESIRVRKGVILAAGGFDKNQAMRDANSPLYPRAWLSGGVGENTGDAITLASRLGAATRNMQSAWAAPMFHLPGEPGGRLSTIERALPGSIMVAQDGRRYMNEAASYHICGQTMARRQAEIGDAAPTWFIFDHRYRHLYPAGPLLPLLPDWAQNRRVRSVMKKGRTIAELARAIGVDPAVLTDTVKRFNTFAAEGIDPDFNRGEAAYDKMYGDPRVTPNPSLRPIDEAPFYAMPMFPGDIGTNGGLVTDEQARVLDQSGTAITGLYAIGNSAASVMGESYPGAGVTIGPALTFGMLAARHATKRNVS
ncbi:FAD-binding protein [Novosphingobium panipatense]|uniref:3-oxosteroid 1-dehydrogenase n=1 Tax=Novosphingobium panipatense TaxID=428991 RepID=A0ABY1Q5W3_9SPHN|nr:FAD-binding protein [Novosphingobium panipatense]SMP60840.1 3-oxosteroid 1-dehydrogenase [Novosphingobium panipatense]